MILHSLSFFHHLFLLPSSQFLHLENVRDPWHSASLPILRDERELWCDTTEGSERVKLRSGLYEVRSWRWWFCLPGAWCCNKANPMHSQPFEPHGLCRVTGSYLVFLLNDEAKIPNQIFGAGDKAWWLSACLAFMRPQVQSSASTTGGVGGCEIRSLIFFP